MELQHPGQKLLPLGRKANRPEALIYVSTVITSRACARVVAMPLHTTVKVVFKVVWGLIPKRMIILACLDQSKQVKGKQSPIISV